MSSLSDHVSLTISADAIGVSRAGFGIPLILSVNATFPERYRTYTDLPGLADDGFATTSPEYLAASALFSQNPHPETIAVGRAVGQPTQRYQINVSSVGTGYTYGVNVLGQGVTATTVSFTALASLSFTALNAGDVFTATAHGMTTGDGPYRMTGMSLPAGTAVDTNYWIIVLTADTFQIADTKAHALASTVTTISGDGSGSLVRGLNDTICAQLVQGLNDVVGKNFTATQTTGAGETDYVVVTANAAGNWFSLEVSDVSLLKIAQTHAEPATALATDLAAITNESDDWYGLITLYNSDAYVLAAAAWIQTVKKIYLADVSDSETATLAITGSDLADDLHTLAYSRSSAVYHPSPAAMLAANWYGTRLPYDPGSEDWKFASPSGVAPVSSTSTHRTNLRAKKANTLQAQGGRNIMWEGTTADGGFIDNIRGLDWLEDDMLTGVFGAMVAAVKIPFTNAGIALIVNEVRASLSRAETAGIIDSGWVVTYPKAADISSANKVLRILPDIKFSATLAGAIHKVRISGVVSV